MQKIWLWPRCRYWRRISIWKLSLLALNSKVSGQMQRGFFIARFNLVMFYFKWTFLRRYFIFFKCHLNIVYWWKGFCLEKGILSFLFRRWSRSLPTFFPVVVELNTLIIQETNVLLVFCRKVIVSKNSLLFVVVHFEFSNI